MTTAEHGLAGSITATAAMLLLALAAPLASAAAPLSEQVVNATRVEPELSREQVIDLVQRRYHARVVRADVSDEGGRRVFVCRLLSGGSKVWIVRIDAHTGTEVP